MHGVWDQISIQFNGTKLDPVESSLEFGEGHYVVAGPEGTDRGRWEVAPSELEAAFQMLTLTGEAGPHRGRILPALLRVRGNLLQLCYGLSENTSKFPEEFSAEVGTNQLIVLYRRRA